MIWLETPVGCYIGLLAVDGSGKTTPIGAVSRLVRGPRPRGTSGRSAKVTLGWGGLKPSCGLRLELLTR